MQEPLPSSTPPPTPSWFAGGGQNGVPGSVSRGLRRMDIILILVLCLAAVKVNWRMEQLVDLDATDEAEYISIGLNIPRDGLPKATTEHFFAPLYGVWYLSLAKVQSDPARLSALNFRILAVLLPCGLYLILRQAGTQILPSALAAFLLVTHYLSTDPITRSIHHATLLLALAVLVALRVPGFFRQSCLLGFGAAVAAFSRPEYALVSMVMFAVALLLALRRRFALDRSEWLVLMAALGGAAALALIFGPPMGAGNDRSFTAFSQNFAYNYSLKHPSDLNPWWEYKAILGQVFSSSDSLSQVMVSNPSAFFAHVLFNLGKLCERILPIAFTHRSFLLPNGLRMLSIENFILAGTLALIVLLSLKRIRANVLYFVKTYPVVLTFMIAVCGAVLAGILLTSTLDRFFFPLIFFGLFFVFFALGRNNLHPEAPANPAVVGVFCLGLLGAAPASPYQEVNYTPVRSALAALADVSFRPDTGYVEAFGDKRMKVYLGKNLKFVHAGTKTQPFSQFLSVNDVGAIHDSAFLRRLRGFVGDPEWDAFRSDPAKFGFKVIPLPYQELLYVREAAVVGKPDRPQ